MFVYLHKNNNLSYKQFNSLWFSSYFFPTYIFFSCYNFSMVFIKKIHFTKKYENKIWSFTQQIHQKVFLASIFTYKIWRRFLLFFLMYFFFTDLHHFLFYITHIFENDISEVFHRILRTRKHCLGDPSKDPVKYFLVQLVRFSKKTGFFMV